MKLNSIILFFLFGIKGFSQQSLEKVLKLYNKESISYIKANTIIDLDKYIFLDTREPNEYNVSHIPNAINVGYNNFKSNEFNDATVDKNTPIIVYCSIGVRSERIGEKLKKMGYTNVQNLYGGIFEWKNNSKNLVDKNNVSTINVHTYSKKWSRFLTSGNAVYEK